MSEVIQQGPDETLKRDLHFEVFSHATDEGLSHDSPLGSQAMRSFRAGGDPNTQRICSSCRHLLATPDSPDLARRGHRVRQAGDPRRRQTVLMPLLIRWQQHRHLAADPDPYLAPAKPQRLRVLQRRQA